MSNKDNIRVRFAPSPTGPLHIGGVRTALYNYLFAKKHNGTFILRIEDTDQNRYVEGAEQYIQEALQWFGLDTDEGPSTGGEYGPYRQSERKGLYAKYAVSLVESGHAYYAFDTTEELDAMRLREQEKGNHSPKYDGSIRMSMRNSLTLDAEETNRLVAANNNVIIRLLIPQNEEVTFTDEVRGEVVFNTSELDDKVILKNDGMPTYHLANIVDDHTMAISHVIRGEEWLSSTAHHVLMYRFFGWERPKFAHLPLIMKPTGKGKLSKRDGAKFGFPVFPLEWKDGEDLYQGFREDGYLPEAVINFLVLLGWNPGDDREMLSLEEMIDAFSLDRIVKSGAKFDIDKSKWFNQQYLINTPTPKLVPMVNELLSSKSVDASNDFIASMIDLMKERVTFIDDFYSKTAFFFNNPEEFDHKIFRKKYKSENANHFQTIFDKLRGLASWTSDDISVVVKGYINDNGLKFGEILPIVRVLMTGSMQGPDLFPCMALIGKDKVINRWKSSMSILLQALDTKA
jgi:glutamyl-tRNA synthetase